jgi:CHAT domain-containing protein/HEAT repeat protein/TolB-like protein
MRNEIVLTAGCLLLLLPLSLAATEPPPHIASNRKTSVTGDRPIRVAVVPFKNESGRPELDWLSVGILDAIENGLGYVHGIDTTGIWRLGSFEELLGSDRNETISRSKAESFDLVVLGSFRQDGLKIVVDIETVDVRSHRVTSRKRTASAPSRLLEALAQTSLELSQTILKRKPSVEETERITSVKTRSLDAWRSYSEALAHQDKAVRSKTPDERAAHRASWEKAVGDAVSADPSFSEAWSQRGRLMLFEPPQLDDATRSFQRSLEIKPYFVEAHCGMGRAIEDSNTVAGDATNHFERCAALNGSNSGHQIGLFLNLIRVGENERAIQIAAGLMETGRTYQRTMIVSTLMEQGIRASLPLLEKAVGDNDPGVRFLATAGLWLVAHERSIPVLLKALKDKDEQVRLWAAAAMGKIGEPSIVDELIGEMKRLDNSVRGSAALALGEIGDKRAVSDLLSVFRVECTTTHASRVGSVDSRFDVCSGIETALLGLYDNAVSKALHEWSRHPNLEFRMLAIRMLARAKDRAAVPLLKELLSDACARVRLQSALALVRLGATESIPAVLNVLRAVELSPKVGRPPDGTPKDLDSCGDSQALDAWRDVVVYELAERPESLACSFFVEKTAKDYQTVPWSIVYGLGQCRDRASVPFLSRILLDGDRVGSSSRRSAAVALARIGGVDAQHALLAAGTGEDRHYREDLAKALGMVATEILAPKATMLAFDPDSGVRLEAVRALGRFRDPATLFALRSALHDSADYVREAGARALGERKEGEAVVDLRKALSDPSERVRIQAARSLFELGDTNAVFEQFHRTKAIWIFNLLRKGFWFGDSIKRFAEDTDPFVGGGGEYLLALQSREKGSFWEQREHSSRAAERANSEKLRGLRILSLWLKVQAQLKLGKAKEALETLGMAEASLEYLSWGEASRYGEEFFLKTLSLKGEVLSALGEKEMARAAYERVLRVLRSQLAMHPDESATRLAAIVRTNLGVLQLTMGRENLEKAIETGRGLDILDSIELENEETRYGELAKQKVAEGYYEESQKLIEEMNLRRTNFLNRRVRLQLGSREKQQYVDEYQRKQKEISAINSRISELSTQKTKESIPPMRQEDAQSKGLEDEKNAKRRELQVFLTNLKKSHPDLAALLGARPYELSVIQEQLPKETAVLQYLLLSDKLIVFVIKAGGIEIVEVGAGRGEIQSKVEALRGMLVKQKSPALYEPALRKLADILIKPVEDAGKLKDVKNLGIAPNGFLHYLPFGALIVGDKGGAAKPLVEKYNLFFMNSTTILGVALDRAKQKIEKDAGLLAFSNPDGSLKHAEGEMGAIEKLYDRKKVFRKTEARKELAKDPAGQASVVHFLTHGVFVPNDSSKSYLLMADGNLTVEDIWGLPFKGVKLATLSACETGLGDILSGDDVVSLENAFIYAGAASVLATLWKVDDESTAELMGEFYKNMKGGMTKTEALTAAQRKLRSNPKFDHPYYWAGFTLRGDWK